MRIFLVTSVTAMLILLELLTGNFGLALGFPLCGAVYFAAAYRKSAGLVSAGCAGLILDALYCREIMLLLLIYPAIVLTAWQIIRYFRRQIPLAPLAAGAAIGAMMSVTNILLCLIFRTPLPGPDMASVFIFQVFIAAVFMMLFTLTADALAFKCNLPRLKNSGTTRNRSEDDE
ncbi:MAG: hypothetical protein IJW35_03095 [Lentisphaeria bacterium]|nr:hypothetical protein [Lentisphaeria bacterium]